MQVFGLFSDGCLISGAALAVACDKTSVRYALFFRLSCVALVVAGRGDLGGQRGWACVSDVPRRGRRQDSGLLRGSKDTALQHIWATTLGRSGGAGRSSSPRVCPEWNPLVVCPGPTARMQKFYQLSQTNAQVQGLPNRQIYCDEKSRDELLIGYFKPLS